MSLHSCSLVWFGLFGSVWFGLVLLCFCFGLVWVGSGLVWLGWVGVGLIWFGLLGLVWVGLVWVWFGWGWFGHPKRAQEGPKNLPRQVAHVSPPAGFKIDPCLRENHRGHKNLISK